MSDDYGTVARLSDPSEDDGKTGVAEDTTGWAHQPDGVDDYSLGKPIGCDYCETIWATSESLAAHVGERHGDHLPIYALLWGVSPDGEAPGSMLETIRLPWRPGDLDDWKVEWENYLELGHKDEVEIDTEEKLLGFLDESDTDEVDWALVVFDASGPTALRERSAYYRPPLEERRS